MLWCLCLFLSAIWAFWPFSLPQPIFHINLECKVCTDTLQDEPSDYHSNIYFMRSKNILHFSPELFQNQLISSCWKRAHCSFDTKDRALLFSFKSAFGGWTAERELSFIMLPCQKDTTLCKRNEVERKICFLFHKLSLTGIQFSNDIPPLLCLADWISEDCVN